MHFLAQRARYDWNNLSRKWWTTLNSQSLWSFSFKKLNKLWVSSKSQRTIVIFWKCSIENQTTWTTWSFSASKNQWMIPELRLGLQTLAILKEMHGSQSPFICLLPPILILVFPQGATFKMEVYLVWRARDGQIGEGTIKGGSFLFRLGHIVSGTIYSKTF